jgi:hypothetical protein
MKFKWARKKIILDEALRLSDAVESLNAERGRTVGSLVYSWSYLPPHIVDSSPYYYVLWGQKEREETAKIIARGTCVDILDYIDQLKDGHPPKAAWKRIDPRAKAVAYKRW